MVKKKWKRVEVNEEFGHLTVVERLDTKGYWLDSSLETFQEWINQVAAKQGVET